VERHGRITFCNPAALNLFAADGEGRLRGKRFSSLLKADGGGADAARHLSGANLKNRIHLPEIGLRRLDERTLTAEFWSHPITPNGDEAEGAVFTLVDITVRKQVQEELSRLRLLLSNIIDSMPSALIGVDAQMKVTQWNRAAEDLFGVTQERAVGLRIDLACIPLASQIDCIRNALQQEHIERTSKLLMKVGGCERFVDVTSYPLIGEGVEGAVVL